MEKRFTDTLEILIERNGFFKTSEMRENAINYFNHLAKHFQIQNKDEYIAYIETLLKKRESQFPEFAD